MCAVANRTSPSISLRHELLDCMNDLSPKHRAAFAKLRPSWSLTGHHRSMVQRILLSFVLAPFVLASAGCSRTVVAWGHFLYGFEESSFKPCTYREVWWVEFKDWEQARRHLIP